MIEMRERPIVVQQQLRELLAQYQRCVRCGTVHEARTHIETYFCLDCKTSDPLGVTMMLYREERDMTVRLAYAARELIAEVQELRPDAVVNFGEPDGLGVVRDIEFDAKTGRWLSKLLNVDGAERDHRIASDKLDRRRYTVTFHSDSPRADDASPWHLGGVDAILNSPVAES